MSAIACIRRQACTPTGLTLEWSTGQADHVPAIWLRDACACERCRDPGSDQHLVDVLDLDEGVTVEAALVADRLMVTFTDRSGSRHDGWVPVERLAARIRPDPPTCVWTSAHGATLLTGAVDLASSDDVMPLLRAVDSYGIGMVHGVPTVPGEVARFAERFGFVRVTNYGAVFDVVASDDPVNLAYTPAPLALHTDNPYRDPVPTVQLLHCLAASATGGATRFADGFLAAERLRFEAPHGFAMLSSCDVSFRFHDATCDLGARGRLIDVDATGAVVGIRVNHRSMEPPELAAAELTDFYGAYRRLCELLAAPGAAIELTLAPGDLVVWDNRRVLHGRAGFPASGARHLQGCYADIDAVRSAVRMAART